MKTNRTLTLIGVFHDDVDAQRAVADLYAAGFRDDQVAAAIHDEDSGTGEGEVAALAAGGNLTDYEIQRCEQLYRSGRSMVTVRAEGRISEAEEILRRYHGHLVSRDLSTPRDR